MRSLFCVLLALLALSPPARAAGAPFARTVPDRDAAHRAAVDNTAMDSTAGRRSPGLALALSVANTAVPVALFAFGRGQDSSVLETASLGYGIVVGPAAGLVYAGRYGRAWKGAAFRAGAAGVAFAGLIGGVIDPVIGKGDGIRLNPALAALAVGGAATAVSLVLDTAAAPRAAAARNRTRGVAAVHLGPSYNPAHRGRGLALRITVR